MSTPAGFPMLDLPYSTPLEALVGPRVRLRLWRKADWDSLAQMLADPDVMEHLMPVNGRAESDAVAQRIERHFAAYGFGLWAMEVPGVSPFIGYTGLVHVPYAAAFTPAVEIGWRIQKAHWGHGYVTEAARLALADAFTRFGLKEVVALTVPANTRSQAVMHRLGMTRDPAEDFDSPLVPTGHRLKRHVLYRLTRAAFEAQPASSQHP